MKPLSGIKVVDLTSYLAAPTTGRVLAEWGADVVKVESFGGDPARRQAGVFNMPMADDENLAFDYANFGKKFVTLNLKSETGMEVMMKLLADADVFLTSNRTKSLVKMGLDFETLHEKFPRLVYAQVTGYGDHGAEKDAAGFDVTCYMARGGVFGTTVNRGDAPLIPTNGLGDFSVSLFLAAGISTALYAREKSVCWRPRIRPPAACGPLHAFHRHRFRPVRQSVPQEPSGGSESLQRHVLLFGRQMGLRVPPRVR